MISIFLKTFVKKSFEQSIQLLAKHLSVFWAATTENFDFFLFKRTLFKLIIVFKRTFFEKKNFA